MIFTAEELEYVEHRFGMGSVLYGKMILANESVRRSDESFVPVGLAQQMPGGVAFSQAVFSLKDVPVGTMLYIKKEEGK